MRRLPVGLLLSFLFVTAVLAAQSGPVYVSVPPQPVSGAVCSAGRVHVQNNDGKLWCCPSGTWVACGSGAAGTTGSVQFNTGGQFDANGALFSYDKASGALTANSFNFTSGNSTLSPNWLYLNNLTGYDLDLMGGSSWIGLSAKPAQNEFHFTRGSGTAGFQVISNATSNTFTSQGLSLHFAGLPYIFDTEVTAPSFTTAPSGLTLDTSNIQTASSRLELSGSQMNWILKSAGSPGLWFDVAPVGGSTDIYWDGGKAFGQLEFHLGPILTEVRSDQAPTLLSFYGGATELATPSLKLSNATASPATASVSLTPGGVMSFAGTTTTLQAPSFTGPLTGNASTASALSTDPTACPAGQYVRDMSAAGVLTCSTPPTGATPGGAAGNVQYNNGTGGLAGQSNFTYDQINNQLTLSGSGQPYVHATTTGTTPVYARLWPFNGGAGVSTSYGSALWYSDRAEFMNTSGPFAFGNTIKVGTGTLYSVALDTMGNFTLGTGNTTLTAPQYTSSATSGSNAFSVSNNGARFHFGLGASDYATSDGSTVSFAGPLATRSSTAASGGVPLVDSPPLSLIGKYWNGSASVDLPAKFVNIITAGPPSTQAKLSLQFGGVEYHSFSYAQSSVGFTLEAPTSTRTTSLSNDGVNSRITATSTGTDVTYMGICTNTSCPLSIYDPDGPDGINAGKVVIGGVVAGAGPISASYRHFITPSGTINGNSCSEFSIPTSYSAGNAECIVGAPPSIPAGLVAMCYVVDALSINLRLCNVTINTAVLSGTYSVRIFNP